jgi:hypothetical protein
MNAPVMNAPVDSQEIAAALGVSDRAARGRAIRESWPYTEVPVRGGRKRYYPIDSLPQDLRERIITHRILTAPTPANPPGNAGAALSRADLSPDSMDSRAPAGGAEYPANSSLSGAGDTPALPPGGDSPSSPGGVSFAAQKRPRRAYDRNALWDWFSRRPQSIQDEGKHRAEICLRLRALIDAGLRARRAIREVARASGLPESTLRRWWYGDGRILGAAHVHPGDYAPALAPRYAGCLQLAEMSPEAWEWIKADWLRAEQPALNACYRRLLSAAAEHGWEVPSYATVERRIKALPWQIVVLAREGEEALKRRLPHVKRLRSTLHALEAVCADGHTFDLRVELPSGSVGRPVLVAWQDIYSGKILAWRVGETLNQHLVRLSFGDLVQQYGVPEHAFLDNGREFANKWMTGGAPTRFRFAIRDDDPVGIFGLLGVTAHWTTPYHGQAKPIERAFRDLCEDIAKHPAAAGAYTGNSPVTKPDNYGSRALKWDEFVALVDEGIRAHNARTGRRTETARGRSFDQTFAESYASSVIRKASAEQRRLWLLAAEGVTVRDSGHVAIAGNLYWGEELAAHAGRRVVVRFDPDRLTDPVHIYMPDGAYIGEASCTQAQFIDAQAAKDHARANRQRIRAAREQLAAERRMDAIAAAQRLPAAPQTHEPAPPAAVRMIAPRRSGADKQQTDAIAQVDRRVMAMLDEWAAERRRLGTGT